MKERPLPVPEEALSAQNVQLTGHGGATLNAYQALPAGDGPYPGVLVIHHMPGWDSPSKEITRRFAASGYNAICPNLYARQGLDTDPDDAAAATRAEGGVPDGQFVGDASAAIASLRALPTSNGKVGVIGYCSGGRHAFLTAISLPVDAAVDCYGAFVAGTIPEGFPLKVVPLVDRSAELGCPLLGLFGQDDQFPSPEQVDELEAALKANGKTYEFHRYEGAGHAFFAVDRTAFRPEAALDGWQRIFTWFGTHLKGEG
jgi:carboxymethylenebutenolidase